ncbi:hypothetical protein YC2023_059915 [Brassica napus]
MFRVSRPGVSRSVNKYKAHHQEILKMKNGEMKQSKKLLEDIAWTAGNCLTVCPSQEETGGVLDIWSHHRGILRQCPQESPLANGQILIDGQVLIRLMADSMTNWRVQVVDGDAHVSVFGDILIQEGWWSKDICVDSLPNDVVLGGMSCLSVQRYKVMLKCSMFKNIKVKSKTVPEIWSVSDFKDCVERLFSKVFSWMAGSVRNNGELKDFDSRLNAHEWNRKAKEEINLQKDVQVSVQALEQVRDFDNKQLGSQLKTLDEGFKKIMKRLQALLKVELREVRREKRKQGDAEDEQACSSIKKGRHKGRVMDLDQTGGVLLSADNTKKERLRQGSPSSSEPLGGESFHGVSWRDKGLYTHDRESNDLVNHIRGVFRYFIVDVVDPGSTPDVAHCGRELDEQFLSHKQG